MYETTPQPTGPSTPNPNPPPLPHILIEVSGGCVTTVYTSDGMAPFRCVLVDHDADSNDGDNLPHCGVLPQEDIDVFYDEVGIELETKVLATLGLSHYKK